MDNKEIEVEIKHSSFILAAVCTLSHLDLILRFNNIFQILYWGKYNCVGKKKDCKHGEMDGEEDWVEVQHLSLNLTDARPPRPPSHVDQDNDVEEEGGEDEEDGGEDPDGQRSQTFQNWNWHWKLNWSRWPARSNLKKLKLKLKIELIQTASVVIPFESEGVVERTDVNMFTSTLAMMNMMWIRMKWWRQSLYEDFYEDFNGEELDQQCGEKHAKASRIGGWWDEKTHGGNRNKHPWGEESNRAKISSPNL